MGELSDIALLAYRNGRYREAIDMFQQVSDQDPGNWLARLYLSMAFEKVGRVVDAHRLLKRISQQCPDDHLRNKAESALPMVEAEMRRRFEKPTTGTTTTTQQVKPKRREDDDIQWVG